MTKPRYSAVACPRSGLWIVLEWGPSEGRLPPWLAYQCECDAVMVAILDTETVLTGPDISPWTRHRYRIATHYPALLEEETT